MAGYKRVRDIREDSDMTQAQVADLIFVNRRTYSCYETGAHMMPPEVLGRLADAFDTSVDYLMGRVDYLMGRTDEKTPYPKSKKVTNTPRNIDVTGLSEKQIQHIQNFVDDLKALQDNIVLE